MNTMTDNRSQNFIFLPFCSLAQAYHAKGLVKYEWKAVIKPILDEIVKNDINIIQMPCPESLFVNVEENLVRDPKSYNEYNNAAFRDHCHGLANQTFKQINALLNNNYKIICILGIEFSPSCAVNIQYTNKGNAHLSGIFIQELKKLLNENNIHVEFLGINRRGINPTIKRLQKLIGRVCK